MVRLLMENAGISRIVIGILFTVMMAKNVTVAVLTNGL